MKNKNKSSDEGIGFTTAIGRAVVTCLALVLVSYIAVLLIARTDGFRQIATDHISNLLELEVDIGQAKISHGLALVLRNVSRATSEDVADVRADSLMLRYRIRFLPWPRLTVKHVEVDGLRVNFVRGSEQNYEPRQLNPLHAMICELLELRVEDYEIAEDSLNEVLEAAVYWRIDAGLIRWLAENGVVLREVSELNLEISPFETSSTRFNYVDVEMRHREGVRAYEDLRLQKVILLQGDD